ncbi:hypothetical protein DFQ26_002431, partial [Actinomortierella ambigua]
AVPIFASAASFVLYAIMGHKLDATIIFPALAFYISTRSKMYLWPVGVSIFCDAFVCAKRIEEFLMADEIQPFPEPDPTCPWAIEIQDGHFYWDRIQGETESKSEKTDFCKDKSGDKITENQEYSGGNLSSSASMSSLILLRNIQLQIPRGALVA